ncbi:MAG: exopolysaccharide biosynthesis polyprenyl glycosylphosphotransferase [Oscillospiraceae bacterium]|nr:exopolysaccharide biosynthesis polyprenyl glycosylphosphotransferase [Oscillospiraceae bacterium]
MKNRGATGLFFAKTMLFIVVLGAFFVGQKIFYEETLFYYWGNYIVLLLYTANLFFTSTIYHGFRFGSLDLREIIPSWILCLIITNGLEYLQLSLLESAMLPVKGFLIVLLAQLALVIPLACLIDRLYYRLNPAQEALIISGDEKKAREYSAIILQHRKKFKIGSILKQDEPMQSLKESIDSSDSVFFLDVDERQRGALLEYCFLKDKRAYILPTFSGVLLNTAGVSWISNTPMFLPKAAIAEPVSLFAKRLLDIVLSLLGIILTSWLMLITLAAIRLSDRHPAIYKQVRLTKGGRRFTIYKFRSMRPDSEDDGVPRLTAKGDARITPVGRLIRRTRIDELPQLFNVLSGAMSLVGPRPERPEIAGQYEEKYPSFSFRTKVKAGITGLAQIYGRYNTAPEEKLLLDIMYIETFSIWQDVKLLLQTVKVLFISSNTEGIEEGETTAMKKD